MVGLLYEESFAYSISNNFRNKVGQRTVLLKDPPAVLHVAGAAVGTGRMPVWVTWSW